MFSNWLTNHELPFGCGFGEKSRTWGTRFPMVSNAIHPRLNSHTFFGSTGKVAGTAAGAAALPATVSEFRHRGGGFVIEGDPPRLTQKFLQGT